MNGRKAKQLRALAGVNKPNRNSRAYFAKEGTTKTKKILHPVDIDSAGKPVVLGTYQTATAQLREGARVLNKMLKRQFKSKQGMFALV
jgi:hypothetical protein